MGNGIRRPGGRMAPTVVLGEKNIERRIEWGGAAREMHGAVRAVLDVGELARQIFPQWLPLLLAKPKILALERGGTSSRIFFLNRSSNGTASAFMT